MNRRDAIKMATLTLATLGSAGLFAASKPLRILILGGTGFIGPHFIKALSADGHTLTLFNRGKSGPQMFPDIETLIGDRDGKIDALKNRTWDVVIDNSGYVPRHVQLTAALLKDHVQQYVFITSISVYADLTKPGITEDAPLKTLKDPSTEEVNGETFGGLKAACERVIHDIYGPRSTILRSVYIVGPGDPSEGFTYWVVRSSRGGEVLAPGGPGDPIRYIDVRDLAEFVRQCVEQRLSGPFNVCHPPGDVTIGELLETSKDVSKSDATFVWVDEEFLSEHKLLDGRQIPIWASPKGKLAGAALASPARAVASGLKFRELKMTARDILSSHANRPVAEQKLQAGLTAERESELLKLWRSRRQ